jgi:tetratricopeptide (TPR) repeat protein
MLRFSKIRISSLFLLLLLFLSACNPQPEAKKLLEQADHFADEEQVDSGLHLIDSIFYPEKSFGKKDYMRYLVTRVRLRYKGFRDIKADTAILEAWRYYKREADMPRRTALAAFYSGCVYREQGNLEKAMHAYSEAMAEAQQTNDNELKGLIKNNIGDLLEKQDNHKQALEAFHASQRYWANDARKVIAISNMGRSYSLLGKADSALICFKQGVALAKKQKDKSGESLLMQNLSVAYSERKEFALALSALRRSFFLQTDSIELPRYYLNFAELYASLHMNDSASFYYELLKRKVDHLPSEQLKLSIYNALADWEKGRGNHDAAFDNLRKEIESIENVMHERLNSSVLDVGKRYDFNRLKITHDQEVIHWQFGLLVLSVVSLMVGILFFIYRIRRKNQIIEAQETINTLLAINTELNSSINRRNMDLRKAVVLQCGITKKLLEFNESIEKFQHLQTEPVALMQRINKIIYQGENPDKQWEAILHSINLMRPGFAQTIEKKYAELTPSEFQVCLLTYAEFKVQEIAVILHLKANTVQTRRTIIRKK